MVLLTTLVRNHNRRVLPLLTRGFSHSRVHQKQNISKYGDTFDKILIANRGEIACRVIRTCKKMGIQTVAIHSDADSNSLHVRMADEAVLVGPAPTNKSYLNVPAILDAIKKTGAQAVHPGYGFLSENSHFVKALDDAGVTFIGPNEAAMAAMGDKIQSKIIAKEAGVHTIPGFNGVVRDAQHALDIAKEIGFPVMLKASAGGGGKGMRIAWNEQEVMEGFRLASQESLSSFGDNRLLVERYIDNPRHIEIQIIGDKHGNTYYLPERECSIQRRNQKVIEEAPSVHLDPPTRRAMGEQAVSLAKNVGYWSAGTVEFLVDSARNFYFLEMNTRLQVEHPITEYITGIDLVEQMIRVAAGQKLSLKQEDIGIHGWAVESRVYAEDPSKYLPSIGVLKKYVEPKSFKIDEYGRGNVRCDSGIVEGSEISVYYDPMICKLCTWGPDRPAALEAMNHALDEYVIQGVTHNIPLLRDVISHPRFQSGKISTKFLAEEYPTGFKGYQLNETTLEELVTVAGMVQAKRDLRNRSFIPEPQHVEKKKEWEFWVNLNEQQEQVRVQLKQVSEAIGPKMEYDVKVGESPNWKRCVLDWPAESSLVRASVEGHEATLQYLEPLSLGVKLQYRGTKFAVHTYSQEQKELLQYMHEPPKLNLDDVVVSPMPGTVFSIAVKAGDEIVEGAEVAVVEAMKMQNVLHATRSGRVKSVLVKAGSGVQAEQVLVEFEKVPAAAAAETK